MKRRFFADRFGNVLLGLFVVLGCCAFVPEGVACADAFETPKTVAWCLVLVVLATRAGGWPPPNPCSGKVCFPVAAAPRTPCSGKVCFPVAAAPRTPAAADGMAPGTPATKAGGMAPGLLLAWMLLRTLLAWPVPNADVLMGWMLPVALYAVARNMREWKWGGKLLLGIAMAQGTLMLLQRLGVDPFFPEANAAQAYAPGRMIGTVGYHNQAVDLLAVCVAAGAGLAGVAGVAGVAGLAAYRAGLVGVVVGWLFTRAGGLATPRTPAEAGSRAPGAPGTKAGGLAGPRTPAEARGTAPGAPGTGAGGSPPPNPCRGWLCFAVVAALCLALPETRGRLGAALRHPLATEAAQTRLTMARAAWNMIRERPLFGWGSGAYAYQYLDRVAEVLPEKNTHEALRRIVYAREPHNDFLHLWCEFGLVGVLLAGWLFVRVYREQTPGGRFLLGYWVVAACFGFPWHDTAAGPLAGVVLGAVTKAGGLAGPRTPAEARGTAPGGPRGLAGPRTPAEARGTAPGGPRGLAGPRTPAEASGVFRLYFPALLGLFGLFFSGAQLGTDMGWWRTMPWQGRSLAREGGLLAMEGRVAEAEKVLERSLQTERSPEQCNNLGFVKMKLGKPAEALPLYQAWADSGIEHGKALRSLAGAYEAMGDWRRAGETLLERNNLWPSDCSDEEVFRMAVLLLRGGDLETAVHVTNRFEKRHHGNRHWTPEWENLAGTLALQQGDRERARQRFRTALERKPGLVSARRNLEQLQKTADQ